jgi:hypothetical protein
MACHGLPGDARVAPVGCGLVVIGHVKVTRGGDAVMVHFHTLFLFILKELESHLDIDTHDTTLTCQPP